MALLVSSRMPSPQKMTSCRSPPTLITPSFVLPGIDYDDHPLRPSAVLELLLGLLIVIPG